MLKGIDPLIGPDLLLVLAEMGHGDEILVADANFPAAATARHTPHGRVIRVDAPSPRVVEAILTLFPLDDALPDPVLSMQVVGDPDTVPETVRQTQPLIAAEGFGIAALERFDFYDRSRGCYAIVQSQDLRRFANFILRKGVIATS